MRRKISKRKRKKAIDLGINIISEGWSDAPVWKGARRGYVGRAEYNSRVLIFAGKDELDAYRVLLGYVRLLAKE